MRFDDRADAARQLATRLVHFSAEHPLVLAIPRGGVPLGRIVADALSGELDVVLVRKLGAPFNPEFAVGAVGESGSVFIAEHAASAGAGDAYLAAEAERQLAVIRRRRARYSALRPAISAHGRTVILIDDGLATGATARMAIGEIRRQMPARLICAMPVAAVDAAAAIAPLADAFVCLQTPADFRGVGQFYRDFAQVDDAEVERLLTPAWRRQGSV
jgi:predicted phosphoribosyltransferase